MMYLAGVLALCSTITFSFYLTAVSGEDSTLRLVNLVYRHGDRSPIYTYPNNPTPNTTWEDGPGWLTKEGERQHYSLGRFLRRRYDGFLSKGYRNTEIRVESSDLDRCLMSAYSNLAGLYPPSEDHMLTKNISWQPIPVHTRPQTEDNMLALWKQCPKYNQVFQDSLKSDRVDKLHAENKEFFDFISEKAGASLNISNMFKLIDTLFCEKEHNITSPNWVNDTIYDKLIELEIWGFHQMFYTQEEIRLKGGPLLKEWLKLADQKRTDKTYTTKMNMFSAHDTTIIVILKALGLYNGLIPPYTTTVIMELHQDAVGAYYVELYFRNVSSQDPNDDTPVIPLTLPGCDFKCPYIEFVSLTKDMVPEDWDAECSLNGEDEAKEDGIDYRRAFIITVAVYSVVALCLLLVVMVICFRRNRKGSNDAV